MIPCFTLNNNLVIIIMHIYIIIIISGFFLSFFINSNAFFLNASDLILPIAIVYVVGVFKWPKCVLPKSMTSHENEGYNNMYASLMLIFSVDKHVKEKLS